jgi:6-pyruvoyltetrahydropterin/6-carboxytetrahydropterin synthase
MFRVSREINFSYGHRLLNHPGKCARLHGHNGRVLIEVASDKLNAQGMVVDFYDIKETAGNWIDEVLDHHMILWDQDPLVPVLQKIGEWPVLMKESPTAEAIARWIFEEVRAKGLPVTKLTLWETENSFAVYEKQ